MYLLIPDTLLKYIVKGIGTIPFVAITLYTHKRFISFISRATCTRIIIIIIIVIIITIIIIIIVILTVEI